MRQRLPIRLAVLATTTLALLVLCELGFRLLASPLGVDTAALADYEDYVTGGGPKFESRPHTVYARPRTGWYGSNSQGFNDEEWTLERAPGVTRIVCLGGSTTESGNSKGHEGSYPWLLERILEETTGEEFDVMNCGISGWTTAESLVAWFLTIQDYDPDLVIVHHAVNDVQARAHPGYRPDYTHWRHAWVDPEIGATHRFLVGISDLWAWFFMRSDRVTINDLTTFPTDALSARVDAQGRCLPETAGAFRRNIESIGISAEARGAGVMLLTMPTDPEGGHPTAERVFRETIPEHNRILRELAAQHGWLLSDAALWSRDYPEEAAPHFIDLAHLDPEGNYAKAAVAARTIATQWLPGRE